MAKPVQIVDNLTACHNAVSPALVWIFLCINTAYWVTAI